MDVVLWVVAGVLAVAFLAGGLMKLSQPKEKLAAAGMGWTEDFSPGSIKAIAALEVLAAVGLVLPAAVGIVLPAAVGIAPVLVPLAAAGLVIVMAGAAVVHARRREYPMILVNLVLLALAAVVAWGRFGPYPF